MKFLLKPLILILLVFLSCMHSAMAENMKKMGSLNVHYSAIPATLLTPKVAKAYGIERSRYNGLLNISVLDNTKAGNPAKTVTISGTARNNVGQIKSLDFDEVKEGSAIYYLAQIKYSDEETLYFTIDINDAGTKQTLKFSQKFYVD